MSTKTANFLQSMADTVITLRSELHYSAADVCRSTRNSFARFLSEEKKNPFSLFLLTAPLLKDYETWMRDHNLSENTISTYFRSLRAAHYRIFATSKSCKPDPSLFRGVHTGVNSTGNRHIARRTIGRVLSGKGVKEMDGTLCTACDLFQLQFLLCGMPYIDLYHLRKKDLRGNVLTYRRHKTGVSITLIVPARALELIRLHTDHIPSSSYLLSIDRKSYKPVSTKKLPKGELSYKVYRHSLRAYNAQLACLSSFLCLDEKLSSYSPRHTWANIAFHSNTPIGLVSRVMGHKSISTTEFYFEPFNEGEIEKENNKIIRLAEECAKLHKFA